MRDRVRYAGYLSPAKDKEKDLEEGFNSGGDDYITKPFHTRELLLRIAALLKRSGVRSGDKVKYRDLVLDINKRELFKITRV